MDDRAKDWIARLQDEQPYLLAGSEWSLHVQKWMETGEGDSGCPLIDTPPASLFEMPEP